MCSLSTPIDFVKTDCVNMPISSFLADLYPTLIEKIHPVPFFACVSPHSRLRRSSFNRSGVFVLSFLSCSSQLPLLETVESSLLLVWRTRQISSVTPLLKEQIVRLGHLASWNHIPDNSFSIFVDLLRVPCSGPCFFFEFKNLYYTQAVYSFVLALTINRFISTKVRKGSKHIRQTQTTHA